MFINRVRRERPPELLEEIKGLTKWVPPPVKMTRSYVEDNINRSRKRMDVAALDMLQFHWYVIAHKVTITVIIFECHFLSMPSSMLEATSEIWK